MLYPREGLGASGLLLSEYLNHVINESLEWEEDCKQMFSLHQRFLIPEAYRTSCSITNLDIDDVEFLMAPMYGFFFTMLRDEHILATFCRC